MESKNSMGTKTKAVAQVHIPPVSISVVLAVYNGSDYIGSAIDSILCQTFRDLELIIINDGSSDDSREIILSYNDSRICLIDNDVNQGLVYSLNKGLSLSRGKYIARMDADDIALPQRLQRQYDFMESHPEIGISGSYVEAFFEDTGKKQVLYFPETDIAIRAFAFFQSPFCHPSVMICKKVMEAYLLQYPDGYYRAEDYALWVDLLQYTRGANIPEVLLRYRKHSQSETAREKQHAESNNEVISRIQARYMEQNGFTLPIPKQQVYSRFVNRSVAQKLSMEEQQNSSQVLEKFFQQLSRKPEDFQRYAWHYASMICFYKFFRAKKIPLVPYLRKLYFRGSGIYLKKVIKTNNKNTSKK